MLVCGEIQEMKIPVFEVCYLMMLSVAKIIKFVMNEYGAVME
jgi:hypothetical protein